MPRRIVVLSIAMVCAAVSAIAQESSLPQRAFLVEGGSVSVAAFVQVDPQRPPVFGKIPTVYVATVRNETDDPIWVDYEIKIKEDKKQSQDIEGGRIEPGKAYTFWKRGFGVVEEAPVAVHFTVYSDEARKHLIGKEETFMYFEKADVDVLKEMARKGQVTLIVGWPEMKQSNVRQLESSRGGEELQTDIQHALWKEESKVRRDCEHIAVEAAALPLEDSAVAKLSDDAREEAGALLEKEQLTIEEWKVRSCDTLTGYQVIMAESPGGGVDFVALGEDPDERMLEALTGLVASASLGVQAAALEGATSLKDYKGQFSMDLPGGWHARDQNPGEENGLIVFSAEDVSRIALDEKKNIKKQVRAIQGRIDSGESPSFFADRRPSDEGASCEGFTQPARDRLLAFYSGMPGLGEGTRIVEGPTATEAMIGGCHGLSVTIKARTKDKKDLVMLIRAVSDGTTHYDFAVRAHAEHMESNKEAFETALATLHLTRAPL